VSDTIISVEGLGKKYVLSHQGERGGYSRFSEKLEGWIKKPFAALAGGGRREVEGNLPPTSFHLPQPSHEEFWALKDVSFEVKRGEVVGIIGRNGAGKSTLLKILSRITEPSEGRVTLRGRVASLLEVGTGFHPELTGRENIFLNGAILGMTKAEIKKKFDEIVAFAEVERFLDTPVKRYSSGMYVRLAFAVAAHLEPEILVVDEVLAVGDAEFQKKCLGKMKDVATGGRTVLFVSHNMGAVKNLCHEGIYLKNGKVVCKQNSQECVLTYLKELQKPETNWLYKKRGSKIKIQNVSFLQNGVRTTKPLCGVPLEIKINLEKQVDSPFQISIMFYEDGKKITNLWTNSTQPKGLFTKTKTISCIVRKWPFRNNKLFCEIYTETKNNIEDWIENVEILNSLEGDYYGNGSFLHASQGNLFLDHYWKIET